jgi:hypothetical protein
MTRGGRSAHPRRVACKPMAEGWRVIGLFLVGSRVADRERAELIVDRLAERRPVSGGVGEWRVVYPTGDTSEAMRMCEEDLNALDPSWLQVLDFRALPSHSLLRLDSA